FPTGTATAETIRSLHSAGSAAVEGSKQAKSLGWAALIAAVLTWFRSAKAGWMPFNLRDHVEIPFLTIGGQAAAKWTLTLTTELVLVGAGALMSFRTGWSLLLGGILTYAFLAPAMVEQGVIATVTYKAIVGWTVWPAASILVASGLTSFLLDWRSVARSFGGLGRAFGRERQASTDPMDAVECPAWWFPLGFVVLAPVVIALMTWLFQIPLWAALIALPLAVVMGFVAARVTGETDVTPTKAFGPVTQLVYGGIAPGNLPGNILAANVTGGIGLHAADLLTTLKTGWLLGGDPRAQFRAQLYGVVAGAFVVVPAFMLLIPDPSVLGTPAWPAPSCLVWAGVSEAFANGLGALTAPARLGIGIGLLLGVALALSERFAPAPARAWVPSPSGLGIAMVIPGSNAIAMFLGALIAEILRRRRPSLANRYVVPVSSGLIAGESLMGILVAMLIVFGVLTK
ncbi:MAG TPA: OPT/YSL family transporter, partial [Candidatus Polarisedimenticolaceae bacterium]|nr:OPT/YSL family transporter [Candidatus Polarisedimenticolaceae bacterium]